MNTNNILRVSGIVAESIVDGPGIRYVIFSQGCSHNCEGCHNPETHPLEGGQTKNIESIFAQIKKNPLLKGVTFSGGEPFLQPKAFYKLGVMIKSIGLDIVTYTGFVYEDLALSKNEDTLNLLEISDFIVDGKYEKDKKTAMIPFKGSSNQRIIDVKKSTLNSISIAIF